MEILHNQPSLSDFTSLSVHQSQTPASFYDGPAVLHHHSPSCSIQLSRRDLDLAPAFTQLAAGGRTVNGGTTANGNHEDTEEQEAEVQIPSVDIYITSEYVESVSPQAPQLPKLTSVLQTLYSVLV